MPALTETKADDRLLTMRQLADRWALRTTQAALARLENFKIPVLRLNGKTCSVYLSDVLAFEQKVIAVRPTKKRIRAPLKALQCSPTP